MAVTALILFCGAIYYAWCHHDAWSYHIGTIEDAKALLKKAQEAAEKCVSTAAMASNGDFASELCSMTSRGCQGESSDINSHLSSIWKEASREKERHLSSTSMLPKEEVSDDSTSVALSKSMSNSIAEETASRIDVHLNNGFAVAKDEDLEVEENRECPENTLAQDLFTANADIKQESGKAYQETGLTVGGQLKEDGKAVPHQL